MASRAPPRRRTAAVPRPRALVRPPRAALVPGRAPTPSPWRPATPPRARARSRTARRRRPSPPVAIAQRSGAARRRAARARTASTARAAVRRTIATGPVAGDRVFSKLFARARVVRWCASAWRSLRRSSSAPCRSSASNFSTSSRARRSVVIPFSACPGRASSRERSSAARRRSASANSSAAARHPRSAATRRTAAMLRTAPSALSAVPAAMLRRSAHCACAAASCCRTQSRADSSSAFAVVNPARAFSAGPIASALSDDCHRPRVRGGLPILERRARAVPAVQRLRGVGALAAGRDAHNEFGRDVPRTARRRWRRRGAASPSGRRQRATTRSWSPSPLPTSPRPACAPPARSPAAASWPASAPAPARPP